MKKHLGLIGFIGFLLTAFSIYVCIYFYAFQNYQVAFLSNALTNLTLIAILMPIGLSLIMFFIRENSKIEFGFAPAENRIIEWFKNYSGRIGLLFSAFSITAWCLWLLVMYPVAFKNLDQLRGAVYAQTIGMLNSSIYPQLQNSLGQSLTVSLIVTSLIGWPFLFYSMEQLNRKMTLKLQRTEPRTGSPSF
jgi:hypothetical protein